MTSTMRHAPQQFRIIQQEFGRRDKRPCPSSRQTNKAQASAADDDEEVFEDEQDGNSSHSNDNTAGENKGRKKPGRKPNPASPAVRKEQNRAAQRAFRDRKERHLQEMETTIKTLKETNEQTLAQSQQLKGTIDTLQSENFYLREVVFSFENALSKTGNAVILQEVKAELYRRHYEKHTTRKIDGPTPPSAAASADVPANSRAPTCSFQMAFIPNRIGDAGNASTTNTFNTTSANSHPHNPPTQIQQSLDQSMTAVLTPAMHPASRTESAIPPMPEIHAPAGTPVNAISSWQRSSHLNDLTMFNMNSEILYKAPPMFGQSQFQVAERKGPESSAPSSGYGRQDRNRPMDQNQRESALDENGLASTVYSGHVSVFDELQSSLFPPGTLQSIIHTSLATPQEIVDDIPLLDQLHDPRSSHHKDPLIAPCQNTAHFQFASSTPASTSSAATPSSFPDSASSFLDDDEINEFRMATPTLGLDDGLKQEVIPSYRLQMEIRVLASAPPAVDPNIDSKIYALPHDSRIDLIPCPKLRAQMILQQNRYHIEDLCDLLIAEAKCHGHPLDPHSWELPDAFFDRYGFLLGEEMLRHRNKIWPKKDEPLQEVSRAH